MPSVLTSLNTCGRFASTSAKTWCSDSTAKSRPLTVKGPTSTPDLILLRNFPVGVEQFLVRAPGFPNFRDMICSVAELKLVLIVSLGGIGTRSLSLLIAALLLFDRAGSGGDQGLGRLPFPVAPSIFTSFRATIRLRRTAAPHCFETAVAEPVEALQHEESARKRPVRPSAQPVEDQRVGRALLPAEGWAARLGPAFGVVHRSCGKRVAVVEVRRKASAALEHMDDCDDLPGYAVRLAGQPVPLFALDHAVHDPVGLATSLRSNLARFPRLAVFLRECACEVHVRRGGLRRGRGRGGCRPRRSSRCTGCVGCRA